MIELSPTVLAVLAASLAAAYVLLSKPRNDKPFPPSPRALPLIGHTHLLSGAKYTWKTLHEISKGLGNPVNRADQRFYFAHVGCLGSHVFEIGNFGCHRHQLGNGSN